MTDESRLDHRLSAQNLGAQNLGAQNSTARNLGAQGVAAQDMDDQYERGWLYNHIGRLSGIFLGMCAVFGLLFLSIAGSKSALGLLLVLVFGVLVISVGGRIRGS